MKDLDAPLFSFLARAAKWRMVDFDTWDLANTAWAFSVEGTQRPKLMQSLGAAGSLLIE